MKALGRLLACAVCCTAALGVLTGCGEQKKEKRVSSVSMVCDDSFENIMQQEIDVFEYVHPNNFVLCRYLPQGQAVDSLFAGSVRMAVLGRDLTKKERSDLQRKFHTLRSMKIAVGAVALITNPENRVEGVSMREIRDIFAGRTTRWNELDPLGADRDINVFFDSPSSGLATFMRDSVMHGEKFGPNIRNAGSIANVFAKVKEHPGAIGVIGVSWLTRDLEADTMALADRVKDLQSEKAVEGQAINDRMDASGVNVLAIRRDDALSFKPYQQYIYDGSYPLTRPIYLYATQSPIGAAGRFYTFVTSTEGQRLIMKTGIMPARMQINIYEVMR